ncbi:MAG TPA: hypothetical protein VGO67_14785 [Verrucomicrobiae bacterium]
MNLILGVYFIHCRIFLVYWFTVVDSWNVDGTRRTYQPSFRLERQGTIPERSCARAPTVEAQAVKNQLQRTILTVVDHIGLLAICQVYNIDTVTKWQTSPTEGSLCRGGRLVPWNSTQHSRRHKLNIAARAVARSPVS